MPHEAAERSGRAHAQGGRQQQASSRGPAGGELSDIDLLHAASHGVAADAPRARPDSASDRTGATAQTEPRSDENQCSGRMRTTTCVPCSFHAKSTYASTFSAGR